MYLDITSLSILKYQLRVALRTIQSIEYVFAISSRICVMDLDSHPDRGTKENKENKLSWINIKIHLFANYTIYFHLPS